MINSSVTTATKEIVDSLLAMNTDNRSVKNLVVAQYSDIINAGKWEVTNQGIGVSENGLLIDGQHRLLAIKKCGYPPVKFLLVTGLNESVRLCVDTHTKRTMRDLLCFAFDCRITKHAPAICRTILSIEAKNKAASVYDVMDAVTLYKDEIDAVVSAPSAVKFFPAAVLAGFVWVAKKHGAIKETVEFIKIVEGGEMLTKKMPGYHLRNFIVTNKGTGGGFVTVKERFLKSVKSAEAYIEGSEMCVLRAV